MLQVACFEAGTGPELQQQLRTWLTKTQKNGQKVVIQETSQSSSLWNVAPNMPMHLLTVFYTLEGATKRKPRRR